MKWIQSLMYLIVLVCVVGSSFFAGYTMKRQNLSADGMQTESAGDSAEEKEVQATARVTVAHARNGVIEKSYTTFGTVVAAPEELQSLSVPFECRVQRVRVVAGQSVEPATPVIDIEPSPDALLAVLDARFTRQATERDLGQVQQRLEMKLATKAELSAAQLGVELAQSKLDSLEKRGIEARQILAGLSGLVDKVNVQEGLIVPAGESLVEVIAADRIQVRIGIEPALAAELKPGHKVHLQTVQGDKPVKLEGVLKLITHRMNPDNRLVEAYVSLPAGSPLMLETFMTARIGVASKQALIVPRLTVLAEEDKHILFTVVDGKAVEHQVEIGMEDEDSVELLGDAVKPGDTVVVQGNAELEDGMAVEIEPSQPNGPTTQTNPATATGSHS